MIYGFETTLRIGEKLYTCVYDCVCVAMWNIADDLSSDESCDKF